jgi:ABC-type oligopeptide transport system substrate-binding subunit/DNA-binding SARP family transcriptional activator/class 3 adenylate cyclase
MEFRILGPLEVRQNGRSLPLARGKQRLLLARFLLHPNEVVSSDRLIDELWRESPPETAATALQGYVSQLRKLIGRERVVTEASGYSLRVDPGELDAERFQQLVAEGKFVEALSLWRGPALADLADEPFVQIEMVRLEEQRLAALEQRIEQDLGLGRHAHLVGELEALVGQHPFRERFRGQLMRALYLSGRQADALEAFQLARNALVDELGIEPSEELKDLQRAILAHDPALVPESGAPAPELVEPMPARGAAEAAGAARTVREERKTVTVLSADLVGSTSLAEQLDPEEVKLVVGEAVARMVSEVDRLGGHVKDLAGDGVLAFFGAPVSSEDDAERALRAGLGIVETVQEFGGEVAQGFGVTGLSVRVGVSTGAVVLGEVGGGERMEYGAFGDALNTAARLQATAEPGAVLADPATERLVEPLFEWGEPRSVELKGKAERVVVRPVERPRPGVQKVRGLEGVATRLVGREREVALLEESAANVLVGSGGMLFVTGDAGIGKSRLLLELRRLLDSGESNSPLWLEGRCVSYGDSLPLLPFRDLLREWVGVGTTDPELRVRIALRRAGELLLAEGAADAYPYLGSLLGVTLEPDANARLAELSPEARQYRTFELVGDVLRRLAEKRPVVVALEDLHWADATSVQLTERLLSVMEESPILLVIAQRRERDHPSWRLMETAVREFPHITRELALKPLSGDAETELLHALVGTRTLPPSLERQLLEVAEGNPFYLEELIRSLLDRGALVRADGGWRFDHEVPVEVPPTVEKVILARVDRLEPLSRVVLSAASVLGRRFTLPLLEGVVSANGLAREALHELRRLDLVRSAGRWPEPEFRFTHALIRETVYGTLLSDTRRELHRRAAEWLERRYADNPETVLGELAHHWLAAEDDTKAIRYLTQAGDHARSEWALDEAIEHYRALLPLLERRSELHETASVLFKLGLALHTALRFAEANRVFQQAQDLWEPPSPCRDTTALLRIGSNRIPGFPDPPRSYALADMQLQMALFDRLVERWPEAMIVPSLAERWEVSDDGLRYVFHLREPLRWSDGTPLTAHDVEYGIKRSLDPERPGVGVSIYYVLEGAQEYVLGRSTNAEEVGVRALDDRTVEFRLAAPAPYFLSVVNRPDGGPQPQHAIERFGDDWLEPERQVISGPFQQAERTAERVVLDRRPDDGAFRPGNVARVELLSSSVEDAVTAYEHDDVDLLAFGFIADVRALPAAVMEDAVSGPPAWSVYLAFDHGNPAVASLELRRALAHAIDRNALSEVLPLNFIVATGGIVPPVLQGHTPEIAPRFDPEVAREWLERAGAPARLALAVPAGTEIERTLAAVAASWLEVLGLRLELERMPLEHFASREAFEQAPIAPSVWFPGYPDPEYYLRLLLHSEATDNIGHWAHAPFDELIERARHEPDGPRRLELFHSADRMAVSDQIAVIPLVYASNVAFVKPWVHGWWEFGKSWSSFADLTVTEDSPRHH